MIQPLSILYKKANFPFKQKIHNQKIAIAQSMQLRNNKGPSDGVGLFKREAARHSLLSNQPNYLFHRKSFSVGLYKTRKVSVKNLKKI